MNVLVVSDNKIYGDALNSIVRGGFLTVAVRLAENVGSACIAMETELTDVLLFDVCVEGVLASMPALRFRWPAAYMVAFGVDSSGQEAVCQRARVDRVFFKQARVAELLDALRDWHGRVVATQRCSAEQRADEPVATIVLSARERQVSGLLEEGFSNKEIARRLGIEVSTVKNHVHSLLQKLNVTSRLEASVKLRRAPGSKARSAFNKA